MRRKREVMAGHIRDSNTVSNRELAILAARVTPTINEVSSWHVAHILLDDYWNTPLVKLLRFMTDSKRVDAELLLGTDADDRPTATTTTIDLRRPEREPASVS